MNQFSLKTSIPEKISKIIPVITLFLVPIFFLPLSSEFYSFNKLALIVGSTIILLILWGIKTIKGEKLEIIKTPIDKWLIALLATLILSTVLSVSKMDSIYGQQGRWLGLGAFAVMLIYYYLSTPAFKDSKIMKISTYLLVSAATISSLVSTLSYYRIFISASPFVRFQNFSLTGSIKDAVLIAVLSVVTSMYLSLREENTLSKVLLMASTAINLFFVAITGTLLGWVLLAIGLGLTICSSSKSNVSENKSSLIINTVGIIAPILALVLIPGTRKVLVSKDYLGEITLPIKESWAVVTSTLRDYPFVGTGPGTFHLNFSRFKPLSMNTTIYWGNSFDKPYNELFNLLSTTGILGALVSVLLFIGILSFAKKSKEVRDDSGYIQISSILLALVVISFALNHATILSVFLMFVFLSMLVGAHLLSNQGNVRMVKPVSLEVTGLASISSPEDQTVISGSYTKLLLAVPAFLIAGYLGYTGFRTYVGEYYMRQSLNAISAGDLATAYRNQISALGYNSRRDSYYDAFSKINMTIAIALASKDPAELTDKDRQDIQALISQALQNSKVATEQVGPLNVSNWTTRAQIYQNLINVAQNALEWSISAYNTAIQLDPVNPQLRLNLGGVYFASGDYLSAANQFRQAITLKQDYANARYNFALSLIALGEMEQAKSELEITKLLLPENSADRDIIEREIQNLVDSIKSNKEQAEKPTVEELTGITPAQQQQEPLTNVTQPQTELGPEVLPQQQNEQEPVQQPLPQVQQPTPQQPAPQQPAPQQPAPQQ